MRAHSPPYCMPPRLSGARTRVPATSARRGFSLVEVIIALGVMSFATTGLIGLLSVGLGLSRNYMNITAESEVVQAVSNELQMTDYSAVVGGATYTGSFPRFYDEGGAFISGGSAGTPSNAFFKVNLQQQSCNLPGAVVDNGIAKTVVFELVRLHNNGEKKTYCALAVNNGR